MEVVMAGPITEIMRVINIMGIGIMEIIIKDIDIMDTEIGHHQGYRGISTLCDDGGSYH